MAHFIPPVEEKKTLAEAIVQSMRDEARKWKFSSGYTRASHSNGTELHIDGRWVFNESDPYIEFTPEEMKKISVQWHKMICAHREKLRDEQTKRAMSRFGL